MLTTLHRISLVLSTIALLATTANAQSIRVTAISSNSVAANANVILTGSGFSTTASQNHIYVGGVRATASSATSTSLTFAMPAGGGGKIAVVNTNSKASCLSDFNVWRSNPSPFGSISSVPEQLSMAIPTVSSQTSNTYSRLHTPLAAGDFDLDGKLDVVLAKGNVATDRGALVHSNNSSSNSYSFNTTGILLSTGSNRCDMVAVADFNGDGKLDIALAGSDGNNTSSNVIYVFRNTSTVGSLSFVNDFTATVNWIGRMQLADVDADGKIDITYSDWYASDVYCLLNNFSSSTLSFASSVTVKSGFNGLRGYSFIDLDNDGKTDLAAGDHGFYQNNSTAGTVSFGTLLSSGIGMTVYGKSADFNLDGKPDLIASDFSNAGVLLNTHVSGALTINSFAAKVVVGSGNGWNGLEVTDFNGDGKADFASIESYIYANLNNYTGTGSIGSSFATSGNYDYLNRWGLVAGDFNLDGRPDMINLTLGASPALKLYSVTPGPTITTSVSSLNPFSACANVASTGQSFTVSGSNLTNNISVSCPSGFEISSNGTTWQTSSITLNQSGGSVSITTIHIRLKSASSVSSNVVVSSAGGSNQNVAVSGTVTQIPSMTVTNGSSCGSGTVVLNAAASDGGTVSWFTTSSTPSSFHTGTSYSASVSSTTTYYVSGTNSCGTTSARSAITATVKTPPTLASNTSSSFVCGTSSASLSASVNNRNWDVNWYNVPTGGTPLSGASIYRYTSSAASYFYYTTSVNATVYVEASDAGCVSVSRVAIPVEYRAVPSNVSASNASRCGTGNVQLSATNKAQGGVVYWYDSNSNLLGTGDSYSTPVTLASTTFRYRQSVNSCFSSMGTLTATISTTATWNGTGNWSDDTKWSCGSGSVPTGIESITVASGNLGLNSDVTMITGNTLSVANNAALTIAPSYALTIASGATLANVGTVVVDADASDYGQLLLNGTYTPSGSGTVTVKRAYNVSSAPSAAKWIQISSPVSGNLAQLGNNIQANNLFYWDAQNNNWEPATGASTFDAGKGYTAFYGPNGVSTSQSGTITLSGTPFNNVAIPTVKWSNGVSNNALFYTSQKAGWNLIGNPFTCNLDYSTFSRSNVDNAFYRWDPNKGGAGQAGYHAHAPAAADFNDATIPPLTAVWIRASSNTSPGLGNGNITHASNGRRNNNKPFKNTPDKFLLTVTDLSAPSLADNLSLAMVPGTSDEFDGEWDAWELINSNQLPNVYANFNAEWTTAKAIDFNDQASVVKVVPVGVKSPIEMRPYRMHLDANLAQSGYTVYLRDLHLNQVHNLSTSDYVFAYTSAMDDRFELILTNAKTGALGLEEASRGALTAWVSGSELWITGLESGAQELDVVGMDGRVVLSTALRAEEGQPTTTLLPELPVGLYTVRVRANGLERGVRVAVQR
jgi:hypothetical protein